MSISATKRAPLTTKRVRKGYYKGKGGTTEGHITSKGKFIHNPAKRLELVVPDLEGFKVCFELSAVRRIVCFVQSDTYSCTTLLRCG